jgi:hypothetical protein
MDPGTTDIWRETWFAGFNGNDEFYIQTQLKNGWVVASCAAVTLDYVSGGNYSASISDCRPGTNSPYTKL